MRLFDTHCHFETTDENEIAAILARAKAAGVAELMAVGGSDALNDAAVRAASLSANEELGMRNDECRREMPFVCCALGWDRDQAVAFSNGGEAHNNGGEALLPRRNMDETSFSDATGVSRPLCAVGEIGLDYYYSRDTRDAQLKLFASELERARALGLPVVIHTREAAEDTISLLKEIPSRGIIHCFTGTPAEAKQYLDLGFFVSISGIVTFKAADNVRETALAIPDDRILIETDSPFLAPVPMRGKPNEPAFIRHTCEFLAKLRGTDPETFAEQTFANAECVLGMV